MEMPDFADRLAEKLDKLVEVGGHGPPEISTGPPWGGLDIDAAAKLIREQCAGILTAAALLKRPIQPCPCCTVMMPKGTLHICREPSIENVDSELRAAGLDPDEVGRRGADLVARLRRPHEDGPTRVLEGGEATVNKDKGTVSIAAGKGTINGEPVSWDAQTQKLEWPEYGVQREDVELDDGRTRGMISKPVLEEHSRQRHGNGEPVPRERKHVQFHCLSCGASVDACRENVSMCSSTACLARSPYEDHEDGS